MRYMTSLSAFSSYTKLKERLHPILKGTFSLSSDEALSSQALHRALLSVGKENNQIQSEIEALSHLPPNSCTPMPGGSVRQDFRTGSSKAPKHPTYRAGRRVQYPYGLTRLHAR